MSFGLINSIFLYSLGAICAYSDFKCRKIYNKVLVPYLMLAIIAHIFFPNMGGVTTSLLGFISGLLLYFFLFLAGWMGAGDVKLLAVFGAWGGPQYALQVGLLAILLGGGMSFFKLLFTGKLGDFISRLKWLFYKIIFPRQELPMPNFETENKIPFGIAIVASALICSVKWPIRLLYEATGISFFI